MELETLKLQRSAVKGKLTRIYNFVQSFVVSKDRSNLHEIKVRDTELTTVLQRFEELQIEIEKVDSGLEKLEQHEIERTSFETKYYATKAKTDAMLSGPILQSSTARPEHFNYTGFQDLSQIKKPQVKLVPLELPKFSGTIKEWPAFKNIFNASVDSADLPLVNKLQYLKTALTGEAANLISSLLITEENYSKALEILTKRYENKTIIVNFHLKAITNTNIITRQNLSDFLIVLQQSLDSLKAIDLPVDTWDVLLVFLLTQKLDNSLRAAWEINRKDNSIATLSELLEFMNSRRTAFELLSSSTSDNKQNVKVSHVISNPAIVCSLCQNNHLINKCPNYLDMSVPKRIEYIKAKCLCYNCLQRYQPNHRCSKYKCFTCRGRHHTSLHMDTPKSQVSYNPTTVTSANQPRAYPTTHNSSHATKLQISGSTPHEDQPPRASNEQPQALTISTTYVPQTSGPTINSEHSQLLEKTHNSQHSTPSSVLVSNTNTNHILLSTAVIRIQDASGTWRNARALLDAGSEVSIVSSRLASLLQLQQTNNACLIQGVGNSHNQTLVSVNANISSRLNSYHTSLNLIVMDKITVPLPHTFIATHSWHIPNKQVHTLADPTFFVPGAIDLLIGAELFYTVLLSGRMKLGPKLPYLIETCFGWVVSGSYTLDTPTPSSHSTPHVSMFAAAISTDNLLQSFWEQEELPQKKLLSPADKYCEELYLSTTTRDMIGRYTVNLPIQQDKLQELGNSFNMAYRYLLQQESRMLKNPDLYTQYKAFIQEFVELGHAHYVDNFSPNDKHAYYMPHFAIIKPDSVSTKLRTVFNGSAVSSSGLALNDILYEGPNIYNDILDVLLRFRLHKFAFSCDIVKMFRGIFINPQQTHLQRILWRDSKTEPLKCLELDTVTYGTKCAPYLACRTMLDLAERYATTHKLASECIRSSSYMDDYLSGSQSLPQCIQLCSELIDIFSKAGFQLHKWSANHFDIYTHIINSNLASKRDTQVQTTPYSFSPPDSVKTLGLQWSPDQDTLSVCIPDFDSSIPNTKRKILMQIAQIFDPIGVLSATTILVKILMQDIWKEKTEWDSLIPENLQARWLKIIQQFHCLKDITIPRYYFSNIPTQIILLGYCDASPKAFGSVLYLRATYSNKLPSCTLVTAKSKVAPLKRQQSIPRLELCGALLLSKLTNRFLDATKSKINIDQIYLFTDSSIVLSWILSPYKLKHDTYVSHRLIQIIDITRADSWHYINTKENPADLLTHGIMPKNLPSYSLWWHGPAWLTQPQSSWPITKMHPPIDGQYHTEEPSPIHKAVNLCTDAQSAKSPFYKHFCKFSSFTTLVRVYAYLFRFIHNLRHKNQRAKQHLTVSELRNAHNFIIRLTQQHSFSKEIQELQSTQIQAQTHATEPTTNTKTQAQAHTTEPTKHTQTAEDHSLHNIKQKSYIFTSSPLKKLNPFLLENILLVGGRIQHSDISFTQAHPIILPAKDHVTSLIVQHYHLKLLHSGIQSTLYNLRLTYWPINGRREVKKCIYSCVRCTRYRGKVCGQQMSDLPAPRVTLTRAFNHVGIDFSGAIAIRSVMTRNCKYSKGYICLFVCLSTRAIHLELVTDMSTQSFICALKRFISRRAIPSCLYTDNATNFKGAKSELHELYKMFKTEPSYSQIIDFCNTNYIEHKFTVPLASHMGGIYEAGIKSVKSLLKKHLHSTKLTYELLYTVLVQIEGIINSRPLYPITDLPNDVTCLTPAHFLVGTAITDLPEPNLLNSNESRLNVYKKIIQIKQIFWKQFYFSYLSELQTRNKWFQVQNNINIGDLVIIKDEATPPTLWPLGRVISTNKSKSDGLIRSVVIYTSKGEYSRPVHKLIMLPKNENCM